MPRALEDILADALVRNVWADDWPKFAIAINDPERGTYDVIVKRYIDADRAGFCGWVTDVLVDDLEQSEAVAVENALNAVTERWRKERAA